MWLWNTVESAKDSARTSKNVASTHTTACHAIMHRGGRRPIIQRNRMQIGTTGSSHEWPASPHVHVQRGHLALASTPVPWCPPVIGKQGAMADGCKSFPHLLSKEEWVKWFSVCCVETTTTTTTTAETTVAAAPLATSPSPTLVSEELPVAREHRYRAHAACSAVDTSTGVDGVHDSGTIGTACEVANTNTHSASSCLARCAVPRHSPAALRPTAGHASVPRIVRDEAHGRGHALVSRGIADEEHCGGATTGEPRKSKPRRPKRPRRELNDGEKDIAERHAAVRDGIASDTVAVLHRLATIAASTPVASPDVIHSCAETDAARASKPTLLTASTPDDTVDFGTECLHLRRAALGSPLELVARSLHKPAGLVNRVVALADPHRACLVDVDGVGQVAFPAGARFVCSDVALASAALASLGERFDLIVADPPWHNKSAERGNKCVMAHLSFDLCLQALHMACVPVSTLVFSHSVNKISGPVVFLHTLLTCALRYSQTLTAQGTHVLTTTSSRGSPWHAWCVLVRLWPFGVPISQHTCGLPSTSSFGRGEWNSSLSCTGSSLRPTATSLPHLTLLTRRYERWCIA
jgi:hypothetical protein